MLARDPDSREPWVGPASCRHVARSAGPTTRCASPVMGDVAGSCVRHQSPLQQLLEDAVRSLLRGDDGGVDSYVWSLGWLVGRVDAREVLELASAGLGVEVLRVALLGDLERRVDEDLDEFAPSSSSRAIFARFGTAR